MKSILFDCERMKYPNTGPYNVCLRLGLELLQHKHSDEEISFMMPKKSAPAFGADAKYYKLGLINKLYLPWAKSRFLTNTRQFDIWHATYQSTMYYPLNKKTKVVLTILDLNFIYEHPDDSRNKKSLALIQDRVDRADHIVSISHFGLNSVKNFLHLDKPSSVIYIGGEFNEASATKVPEYIPQGNFLFSLGTVLPKKNFHVLPCLLQHNALELVIAGINSSPYKNKILEEAIKFNVADRVHFTGPIAEEEKTWYYKNCTAFLFPSIAEGFGLPAIEAMAQGKPTFLSTHTALPEIGGEHAYYFQDFSPETMRKNFDDGMRHFNDTHPEEKIKEWAAQFNYGNTAESYLKIYRSLLKN